MKKIKEFFIRSRKRLIVAVSLVLILIALVNIHFIINVASTSNDECLWKGKKIGMDSIAIFFDLVKVDGVTWEAGIRNGDQLLKINGITLPDVYEAQRILNKVKEANIQGVIYYVVRGCMLYAMEYTRVKKALDKINVPVYYLDTEYTREDVGQMKTRVEAFLEMLTARVDF